VSKIKQSRYFIIKITIIISATRGGGGGVGDAVTNYLAWPSESGSGLPLHCMCFCLLVIIYICGLYKLTLSDHARVAPQLRVIPSESVERFLAGRLLLEEEAEKKKLPGFELDLGGFTIIIVLYIPLKT
jgi:hypothetical protein